MDETSNYELHTQENWQSLAELLKIDNPLFEKTFFLFGYDFSCNIYLLQGDYLSIIDPGNDYTAFMQLHGLGFKLPDIKKIALTHGHQDHVMGTIELFRGYPGYRISDVEIIMHEAGPRQYKELVQGLGCRLVEVKGGERINLSGFEFEVIHTPGHTLDGISFYHEPTQTLFPGDTVLPHAMAEVDQAGGGRMDHYLYSLRTLRKRKVQHLMPGHGGLVAHLGRQVVEGTFEGLIKKLVGLETPFMEGAMTLAQQGLLEEALFYTQKELTVSPDNPRALEMQAFLLLDLGRNDEAAGIFDKILQQDHRHFHALLGKGRALIGMGGVQASLGFFDQALEINPQDPEALVNKGLALYLSGRQDEAMDIEIFQKEFARRVKQEFVKEPKAFA
ncbi:MAG: MBL fold metallo-hydrolase [Deltaproteobacteria bacterium]|nr:MBL fold metallo-hydrolase [Deltaproteobacteria bacterium]